MFPSYPGFEDLPIRVQVEWQGRARPVVARLERWPGIKGAYFVCSFEDADEGEWIVRLGHAFHSVENLTRLVCRYAAHDLESHEPRNSRKFSTRGEQKISALVQRAFVENNANCGVVRAIRVPDLPDKPSIVVEYSKGLFWCPNPQWFDFTPFHLKDGSTRLPLNASEARQQVRDEWQDGSSDVRFAWEWATLSLEERFVRLTGFRGNWRDLEDLMSLILMAASSLWQTRTSLEWMFDPGAGWIHIDSATDNEAAAALIAEKWMPTLQRYFVPCWESNCLNHPAADLFWRHHGVLPTVWFEEPPTAHEQLEAKLRLRDWLEDKATPAQIKELLDT